MAKYKSGDPVWARQTDEPSRLPGLITVSFLSMGEHPAVVIDYWKDGMYYIELLDVSMLPYHRLVTGENYLRPRRDDYQQLEGLGSMNSIDQTTEIIDKVLEEV